MDFFDLGLFSVYSWLLIFFALKFRDWAIKPTSVLYKVLVPGLIFKIVGSFAFALAYTFYFPYGDSFNYFDGAVALSNALIKDPVAWWQIMSAAPFEHTPRTMPYLHFGYAHGATTFIICKLASIPCLLGAQQFFTTTLLFSVISYSGTIAFVVVFTKLYPQIKYALGWALICIPSVVFWGSGILKDTVTYACLGWLLWGLYSLFKAKKRFVLPVIVIVVCSYLLIIIKVYIFLIFLPFAILWLVQSFISRFFKKNDRLVVTPALLILSIIIIAGSSYFITKKLNISTDSVKWAVGAMQYVHNADEFSSSGSRSGYDLGDYSSSVVAFITTIPKAINVSLFRPYLWEVNSPAIVLSAIESLLLLIFTVVCLVRLGISRFFRMMVSSKNLKFFLFFALSFAFVVGFISYNFGALTRYKIPLLPFYMVFLVCLYYGVDLKGKINQQHN